MRTMVAACFAAVLLVSTPALALSSRYTANSTLSPDALWAKVGDFCNIKTWLPAIDKCTLSNDGKTRTLGVKGGGTTVEDLISRDDSKRTYSYRAVSGLPLDDYQSTIVVEPATGGSTLVWTGTYKAKGSPTPRLRSSSTGSTPARRSRRAARRFDGEGQSHRIGDRESQSGDRAACQSSGLWLSS